MDRGGCTPDRIAREMLHDASVTMDKWDVSVSFAAVLLLLEDVLVDASFGRLLKFERRQLRSV